ncbi:dethiobiotin synthase [Synechococcus sp. PCC 6312]|uniref:dethiobiotin synthase n=1 Tax=Synechococcus sp. (strain ATCC 27167 / PCC 6312) TaxID=195253 RepID=UPI00029F2A2D|nr:dethiobiotin synthase [Synechococcus sp. PCC 6312]AFY62354.1 dethiobiotin synthase [Synechococcus sp. PCC 6312]
MTPGPVVLITGTDTEVGKTWVTSALFAYFQAHAPKLRVALFKPLQSGAVGDQEHYHWLFDLEQSPAEVNPVSFQAPLAPPLAAALENKEIDLAPIWQTLQHLRANYDLVLMEGIGGLGSPITWEWTVADLVGAWRIPIVLVVPVRLGAMGQAVANLALAREKKLTVRGLIRNCLTPCTDMQLAQWANPELLETLTHRPVLGTLPYLGKNVEKDDIPTLANAAANLQLEALFPEILGTGLELHHL